MRIAVDAMGGDFAPEQTVAGAVEAARKLPNISKIVLVGREDCIRRELDKHRHVPSAIEVYHASEVIEMGESPALAVRRKKDSSVGRCADLVKKGHADAFVSAGNTGAVVVAASLKLRALEGVERPAIAAVMPTIKGPFVLVDAGANIDCNAKLLAQFAIMGRIYSREILHVPDPIVGLLSIGGEESKGNEVTKEAFNILSDLSVNFKGNVEGHDLFEGETDVVVCDGFVGNVVLKTSESVSKAIAHLLKQEIFASLWRKFAALLLGGVLRLMKKKMDPDMYGGAPLLGVNGVCIITHGSSSKRAIYHSIRVARDSLHQRLNELIIKDIGEAKL